MKRETKFNYGFLFVSLAVPLIADYFLGRKSAVIAAIVIFVAGFLLLLAGHQHREKDEEPIPRGRLRRAVVWSLISGVLGTAAILISAVLKRAPSEVPVVQRPPSHQAEGPRDAALKQEQESKPANPPRNTSHLGVTTRKPKKPVFTIPESPAVGTLATTPRESPSLPLEVQQSPAPTVNYAPQGFAVSGGTLIQPTINNFGPPPLQVSVDVTEGQPGYGYAYAKSITLHSNGSYSPVSLGVFCDADIDSIVPMGVILSLVVGQFSQGDKKAWYVTFDSPAVTPERSVVIEVLSKNPFNVIDVKRVRLHFQP